MSGREDDAAGGQACPAGCPLEAGLHGPDAQDAARDRLLQELDERGRAELRQMALDAARKVAYKYDLTARLSAGSVGPAAEGELAALLAEWCGTAPQMTRGEDGRATGVLWRFDCYRKAVLAQEALLRCPHLAGLWLEGTRQPPSEERQEPLPPPAEASPAPREKDRVLAWEDGWL